MEPVKISEKIFWVGIQDPAMRVFDILLKIYYILIGK